MSISYGTFWISRKRNFKNRSFLSDQKVVQIKPNLVWRIPRVGRLWDRKSFWYSLPRKQVSFSYGKLQLFRLNCNYWISKIGLFRRVKELCKWNQTWYGVSPVYIESETKRFFCYNLPRKKVSFSYGFVQLFQINNSKSWSISSNQGVVQIEPNSACSIPCVP